MRRVYRGTVLAVGLSAALAAGQDGPVTIKIKRAGPGDVARHVKSDAGTTTTTVTAMGKTQTQVEETTTAMDYTEEVIARPAEGKPTKAVRTYAKAAETKGGKDVDLGLAGKKVLIEKVGAEYKFAFDDGTAVAGPAADRLRRDFAGAGPPIEQVILPPGPVKPGDSWKLDIKKVAKAHEDDFVLDPERSTAAAKLVKTHVRNGHLFGVLEVTMDLAVAGFAKTPPGMTFKPGNRIGITMLMDGCIDGTEDTGGGKMEMTLKAAGSVPGVELTIEAKMKGTMETTEMMKK